MPFIPFSTRELKLIRTLPALTVLIYPIEGFFYLICVENRTNLNKIERNRMKMNNIDCNLTIEHSILISYVFKE